MKHLTAERWCWEALRWYNLAKNTVLILDSLYMCADTGDVYLCCDPGKERGIPYLRPGMIEYTRVRVGVSIDVAAKKRGQRCAGQRSLPYKFQHCMAETVCILVFVMYMTC